MRLALLPVLALALSTSTAFAELVTVSSSKSVSETADALAAAVEGAGAKVFARVNHGAGAESVGMELADAELLVFGNPKLGTPALQADPRAGLYLPLRVLVYADEAGATQMVYEVPGDMLSDLDIPADAEVLAKMSGALANLTAKAAE